jgi:hypothetical protein
MASMSQPMFSEGRGQLGYLKLESKFLKINEKE